MTHWRARVPHAFATFLRIVAVVCVVAAVGGALRHRFQPVRETINALFIPAPANLGYAAFLFVLATATNRRKRIAYWVLVGYFSLSLVSGLLVAALPVLLPHGRLVDEGGALLSTLDRVGFGVSTVVAGVALVALVAARREFYARVRPGSLRQAVAVFAATAAVGIGLGYALVNAFPGTLSHDQAERFAYSVEKVLGGAITFDLTRAGRAPGWVNLVLGLFGAIAVFAALFTLLRSQRAAALLTHDDEQRVRVLLDQHGDRDSLGYFATRRDKAVIFSPTGKAAVTYRVVSGVTLASADPIGDVEAWGPAIDEWLGQARQYAWTPAVMGASEEGAMAYARAGLRVLQLGDEAILYVNEYTLDGRDMRPVRQAVRRVERAGYTAAVRRHADVPAEELREAAALASRWRDTEAERGFSMALGRLGDPADGQCVLVEAYDEAGAVHAMLSFSPWGSHGLSLDLMRRAPDADNGVVEFMVTALTREAPKLGVDRISLNFAVFRAAFAEGARIGAGPVLQAWRRMLMFLSRWWQLESLYRANAKFQPHWTPRYVCFGDRRELAKVGIAFAIAEGFLTLPRFGRAPALPTAPVEPVADASVTADSTVELVEAAAPDSRQAKLARMRELGMDPYPVGFAPTDSCAGVAARYPGLGKDVHTGATVAIAGRAMLLRDHGRLCFATVRDWTGDLQVMLEPAADLDRWRSTVDIGDQVWVHGEVVTSRRGELSVLADRWAITGKSLRPLPDKHGGMANPEARVRQRYLDLIVNEEARDILRARGALVHGLREALVHRGFLEVETPILQRVHGGANARPFTTHINAYDLRLYLRIAPELYLKRLVVGGVDRVFELGRTFRNEGVSVKHNPEFTMLEAYQAYADYDTMRRLTQDIVREAATAAYGSAVARHDGAEYDISGDWPVRTVNEALSDALGEHVTADTEAATLCRWCDAARIPYDPKWERGAVLLEMYERLVEQRTTLPTFYTDFPTDVSPLTRQHRVDPRLAERWDLVAFGTELGTAYTELTDPVEQRRRLTDQSLRAAGGDPEAMELDEEFLLALEYAMPPTGGLGIGVDRLVMLLTGRSIRETLAFPLVRAT